MNNQPFNALHYRALLAPVASGTRGLTARHAQLKSTAQNKSLPGSRRFVYDTYQVNLKMENGKALIPTDQFTKELSDKINREVFLPPGILMHGNARGGSRVRIDSVVLRLPIARTSTNWVSSPVYQVLPLLCGEKSESFYRCDLRVLSRHQFQAEDNGKIRMTRINLRYGADTAGAIKSMTLYGNDVLSSPLFYDMVMQSEDAGREHARSVVHDPFNPKDAATNARIKRLLVPYSCRLRWDDGSGEGAFINLDRHGNFSYYLKDERTLELVGEILSYLDQIGALSLTSVHPLLRSSAALSKLEG